MSADRQDLRRRLIRLAALQAGEFTAAQARATGYSHQAQRYHADRGNWTRIDRGLYRLPEWPHGEHEELVRWCLWSRNRAVVSHETALAVYDLGDVNPARDHLTVPSDFTARPRGAVLHRGERPAEDIASREGFQSTSPLRTLLDTATGDLGLDPLRTAIEDACERGMVTPGELLTRADYRGDRAALRVERSLRLRGLLDLPRPC